MSFNKKRVLKVFYSWVNVFFVNCTDVAEKIGKGLISGFPLNLSVFFYAFLCQFNMKGFV